MRDKNDFEQLAAFLRRLRCRALYFEPDDNAGIEAYRHFSDAQFVNFVQTNTGLRQTTYLGNAKEGRAVYLLSNT